MAKVEIVDSLVKEIQKKFKGETHKIVFLLRSLELNPNKGKLLGQISGFQIKELKYKKFRFYFIVDEHKLNFLSEEELVDLLMKFVRMSDKKTQKKQLMKLGKFF